jgi:hypothetical protein
MAVAPSLVSHAQTTWTSKTSPKTIPVTVQNGDLIVVAAMADGPQPVFGISGGSLTWTQQQLVTAAGYAEAVIWSATATTTTTFSVSVSNSGPTAYYGASATVWRYHGGIGTTAQAHGDGIGIPAFTSISDDSAVVVYMVDYSATSGAARTWRPYNGTAATETVYGQLSGEYTWYGAYYPDTNAATTDNMGLNTPGGLTYSFVALEIKSTATGVGTSYAYPTALTNTGGFGAPTVSYGVATRIPVGIASTATFGNPTARVDTWRQIIEGASWREAVTAHQRTVGFRGELIDANDNHVIDVPLTGGSVSFDGESAEQWACQVTIAGEEWVPRNPGDYLDPRTGLRFRIWWRLMINGGFVDVPTGTFVLEDPRITDDGAIPSTSVRGRDPLTVIRRAGYGSSVISVGGMTVPAALIRIMGSIAPRTPFRIDATSYVTLPATYELTGQDPVDDMTNIASQAGLVIRTDPEGRVVCSPNPTPQNLRADWQEGPDCPVTDLSRAVNTSQMVNSVTVVSTNPEVVPPISITVEDTDPSSTTWIGGPWGKRTLTIRTDSIATDAGARSMATGILNGRRRPQEEISIEVPPRGDLGYRDKVSLARSMSGVANTYRIAGWALAFGNAQEVTKTMTVKMISRTLV